MLEPRLCEEENLVLKEGMFLRRIEKWEPIPIGCHSVCVCVCVCVVRAQACWNKHWGNSLVAKWITHQGAGARNRAAQNWFNQFTE